MIFPQAGKFAEIALMAGVQPVATYTPGQSQEISFVRACITTEIFSPFIGVGLGLPKNSNDRFEIISTIAFANEPF